MIKCIYYGFCLLIAVPSLFAQSAQTIVLTAPCTNVSFAAGDEFATTVAGNAWNMKQIRDIPYDINFQEPTVANNEWSSTFLAAGAPFYPLWRGFSTATAASYPYHVDGCMPLGQLNPIDAAKYSRMSMRISTQNRSSFWVIWTTNAAEVEKVGVNTVGFIDGDCLLRYGDTWNSELYAEGYRIYDLGFNIEDYFLDRISNPSAGVEVLGPWTGNIYGFLIEATQDGAVGTEIKVDWIRVYDPTTSPKLQLHWQTTGVDTDDQVTNSVQVWVDTDNSGYDGDLLATCLLNDGLFEINTAALAPSNYYFYLQLVSRGITAYTLIARSAYSARVTITHPPSLEFTAPTYTSGDDYATVELGNPWDMTDVSDIYEPLYMSGVSFADGMMIATAQAPTPPETESDDQFYLNTRLNNEFKAIDASRYRYLTYRMMVDPTGYLNINDWVAKGWLPRVIWFNTSITNDGSEAQGIPMLEGWHSYSVDLADRALLTTENPYPAQVGWRELGSVKRMRFDPLEVPVATSFAIDDIKLCDDNRPSNNRYTISWTAADPDSTSLNVSLYYGALSGSTFSGALITTVTQSVGAASYVWDTSGVRAGSYYIQAIISDGTNSLSRVSHVPVVVGGTTDNYFSLTNACPLSADFDGDYLADPALYQDSSGSWQVRLSASGYSLLDLAGFFGGSGYTALAADFDGDGLADPAVYQEATGNWQVKLSGSGYATLSLSAFLGGAGYTAVAADFDGDGLADPAVYEAETASWMILLSSSGYSVYALDPHFLGGEGYTAVAADFDGDGLADPAVYHNGDWNIKLSQSGYSEESKTGYLGGEGYTALAADFDGDGLADYAVFQAATWTWQIRLSTGGYTTVTLTL